MVLDIIVGSPPYQEPKGEGHKYSIKPLFDKFVDASIDCAPIVLMLIPNKWMLGGCGLEEFKKMMLKSGHIKEIHTYKDVDDLFAIRMPGGVDYFLYTCDYSEICRVVNHPDNIEDFRDLSESKDFVMSNVAMSILEKADYAASIACFSDIVSERMPFGLADNVFNEANYYNLPFMKETPFEGCVSVVGVDNGKSHIEYVDIGYPFDDRFNALEKYKIFMPKKVEAHRDLCEARLNPILGDPYEICTDTYLMAGPFDTEFEQLSAYSYINSKLFHFLVTQALKGRILTKEAFRHVPRLKMHRIYTDSELYDLFDLTEDEIKYIEDEVGDI